MKMFLTYVLPVLAPALTYVLFMVIRYRLSGKGTKPDWASGPWFWLAVAGVGLLVLTLLSLAYISGQPETGAYEAPWVSPAHR